MYEAKQNMKPISRTFSQSKTKPIRQFENTRNQKFFITQLCRKSSRPHKPVNRTEPTCKPHRVSTFYGLLKDLKGRQGPHVVAFAAIHSMLESFNHFMLNDYFFYKVFHPNKFADSIFTEILQDEKYLQNSNEWGNLYDIHTKYGENYDLCSELLNSTLNIIDNPNSKTNDYEENVVIIRNLIEELVNMNIYATYAWHRNGGATKEELAGGGERAVNTADFTTAKEVLSSNCLDILFATSGNFTNYLLFCDFLESVFPNLPRIEIDNLLLSLPNANIFFAQLNYNDDFVEHCVSTLIPNSQLKPDLQLIILKGIMSTDTNITLTLANLNIDYIAEILSDNFNIYQDDVIWVAYQIILHYDIHSEESEKDNLCQMIIDNCRDLYNSLLDYNVISEEEE